jgi:hypothetical protein
MNGISLAIAGEDILVGFLTAWFVEYFLVPSNITFLTPMQRAILAGFVGAGIFNLAYHNGMGLGMNALYSAVGGIAGYFILLAIKGTVN